MGGRSVRSGGCSGGAVEYTGYIVFSAYLRDGSGQTGVFSVTEIFFSEDNGVRSGGGQFFNPRQKRFPAQLPVGNTDYLKHRDSH